jgi:hypothetical protein
MKIIFKSLIKERKKISIHKILHGRMILKIKLN